MEEVWKDIKGYEGYYQISNFGRVKSLERFISTKNNKTYLIPERILCSKPTKGYPSVGLSKNGVSEHHDIHRLVAEAFIPNIDNKPQIDHIDGNKHNNMVTNLHWVTSKENCNNPVRLEKFYGENNAFYGKTHTKEAVRKIIEHQPDWSKGNNPAARTVIHGKTGEEFETVLLAAANLGVCETTMRRIINKETFYKNDGTWRYKDENRGSRN